MCAGLETEQLAVHISRIEDYREEGGVANRPFKVFTTGANAFTQAGIDKLEEIGVTDVVIGFRNLYECEADSTLDEKIAQLNWYASEFIKG